MSPRGADSRSCLPEEAPRQLGLYRIVRLLGRGGMGMVFEGYHSLLRQRVAVKVLHPSFARDPRFVARFQREMAAQGQIPGSAHLVRAQYAGEEQGVLYLAMDFVEGEDLAQLLGRRGPLSPAEACEVVRQAALGLEAIHRAGLVHRDLKPSNLILTPDGTVKILDLGLARLREPESSREELTPTNMQLGTFDYQAPEQADDPRNVDVRADVYSLGCTLYTLLTGRPPYSRHPSAAKKIYAHAHLAFPAPGPETPAGLGAVLARMTAKQPQRRHATPKELADALAPFAASASLSGLSGGAPAGAPAPHEALTVDRNLGPAALTTVSVPAPGNRARPRGRTPALLTLGVLVILVLVAAVLYRVFAPPEKQGNADAVKAPDRPRDDAAADPILAAGNTPRPLDELAPNLLHDLLDRAPVQAYWDAADGTAFRTYDTARKQFIVHSPREGLFSLGTLGQPSYTLTVQIQQAQWGRGAGVYLGYHDTADAKPAASFQYLIFSERTTIAGMPVCVLTRGRCTMTDLGGRKLFDWSDKASQDVDAPLQEAWLIVEVVGRRLFRVRLNGVELKKLAEPPINKAFTEADYQGGLGLLTSANGCVFHQATLTLLPGR